MARDASLRRALAEAGAHDPVGGEFDISFLSTSTDSPDRQQATKRQAGRSENEDGAPRARHRSGSRPGAPAGPQAAHLHVDIPDGDTKAVVHALVEQGKADRDFMAHLQKSIVILTDKLSGQDIAISGWKKWHEDNSRKLLTMEGRVQEGANESRRAVDVKLKELQRHLEPIFAKIDVRIDTIGAAITANSEQQGQTHVYLQALKEQRPEDGQTVMGAFKYLEEQLASMGARQKHDGDMIGRRVLDEAKRMLEGFGSDLKNEVNAQIGGIGANAEALRRDVDARFVVCENEILAAQMAAGGDAQQANHHAPPSAPGLAALGLRRRVPSRLIDPAWVQGGVVPPC